jgi:hypothetical protein
MNTTGKQVNPGDLITAALMNGVIADLKALDARIAKLESGGAGPVDKGHGSVDVIGKGIDNAGNKKIGWIQLTLKDADQKARFTVSLIDKAKEFLAANKYEVLDSASKPLQQPFTLEPDQPMRIGFRFVLATVPYTSGSIQVNIHCEDYSDLSKTWVPVMVA